MSLPACIAIFGRRRSGKTTKAQAVVKALGRGSRILVFDVMAEWCQLPGFARADSLAEVKAALMDRRRHALRLAYVPRGDYPRMLHGLALLAWAGQEGYQRGRNARRLVLVVEEMNLGYPATSLPAALFGMTRAIMQGGHRGLEVVGISQRPAEVSASFRGNCSELYLLPLAEDIDVAKMLRTIGRRHESTLRGLKPHQWLRFTDGTVTTGRSKKR